MLIKFIIAIISFVIGFVISPFAIYWLIAREIKEEEDN